MTLPRRQFMQFAALAAVLPIAPRIASAQAYPTKPIHLVVPAPPAGTFDIVARLVANATEPHIGQKFIIENRGGAGTNLGTGTVAHAAPDGYTLLLAGSPGAINATLYHNL
ncbi:MAG TPA: tripartite tricarboxylate transporter substrate-binding protein, partial [Xanthobacteraceae bacterium]|nr:tripartite tricarboxylate transporter substrate-binding protein [Xanthobacteraceae bacterium]